MLPVEGPDASHDGALARADRTGAGTGGADATTDLVRAPVDGHIPPADLVIGAFSDDPPWLVDLDALVWRSGVAQIRADDLARTRRLLRRRSLPPVLAAARVAVRLGAALGGWYVRDRRRGQRRSRTGLSRRLRRAFVRLGPTYIKLGQILSAGEGVFPEELVGEFRLCRDQVPAEPFATVRRTVEEDLGAPLDELFSWFDPVPIAAASIAQVHAARLVTGEAVVVKVQRPRIRRQVRRDLAVMSWLAPLLVGRIPVAALANPPALVEVFAETITEELDFRVEAQNMLDVAYVLSRSAGRALVVPRPHPRLVSQRVLVMERLTGFAWGDADKLRAAGIDTGAVLTGALIAFIEGLTLYGVFHGDLHAGNLLVRSDGRVALLDFGITGRLDERGRRAFLSMVMSTAANDVRAQVGSLRDLGALPPDVDLDAVIGDLGLDRPPVDPTTLTAEELTAEIRDVTKALLAYGARVPKALMLFVKDMLFIDNAMATMAPDVDVLGQIMAVLGHLHREHGDRIAQELGLVPGAVPEAQLAGIRSSLGLSPDIDRLTYAELQARRRLIRRRLEHQHRLERHTRAASADRSPNP